MKWDEMFLGRPQSFRYHRRPVDDCSPEWGGNAPRRRNKGTFHGEIDRWRESQGWTTTCSINSTVCRNVTGRTKERTAQSKRARVGLLAIVDQPQVAQPCILRAVFLACRFRVVVLFGVTFVFKEKSERT